MHAARLGRTNLEVSVIGLGGGGYSKLGTSTGADRSESIRLVRAAVDLGINLFDSAEGYGTEDIFGEALRGIPREQYVLCTKAGTWGHTLAQFEAAIDNSLRKLRTDYIDLYQFHGVSEDSYPVAVEKYLPVLVRAREKGKIRFIGITEQFEHDFDHAMARRAVHDSVWDSMMIGCNILNFSARTSIFPATSRNGVGILGMFAVRYALVNQQNLAEVLRELIDTGAIDENSIDLRNPLGFLLDECDSLAEAAYRFCRHLDGIDVVLSGTGSIAHLRGNVAAVSKPPLSAEAMRKIELLFGNVSTGCGKRPGGKV